MAKERSRAMSPFDKVASHRTGSKFWQELRMGSRGMLDRPVVRSDGRRYEVGRVCDEDKTVGSDKG
jgi:hypothetical protein